MRKNDRQVSGKKMDSWISWFKKAKFVLINLLILVMLAIAFISGDGKKILLNFYTQVTGQTIQSYSPVGKEESTGESYMVLKYKLLQDQNLSMEDVEVTFVKESEISYNYRVVTAGSEIFYKVKKNSNGIWQINRINR